MDDLAGERVDESLDDRVASFGGGGREESSAERAWLRAASLPPAVSNATMAGMAPASAKAR